MYLEKTVSQGIFYINGEQEVLSTDLADVIPVLCDQQSLTAQQLESWLQQPQFVQQLTTWVNAGYWYFEQD